MTNSIRALLLAAPAFASSWAFVAQAQTVPAGSSSSSSGASSSADWSIKPRGRLQLDYGNVTGPALDLPVNQVELGPDTRVRRAYLGVDVTIPGNWGARFEVDFAAKPVTLVDAYVFYKPRNDITITAGHHKPFWGMEELGSDNFTSFQERSSFSTAFGFERRLGVSASYVGKSVIVQGGVFTDDLTALGFPDSGTAVPRDFDDAWSFDARAVYMPKIGANGKGGRLHFGGSVHYRETKGLETVRYRARPFVRTTDLRFVDTGNITGTGGELGIGLEGAYVQGPFHASVESFWQKALRPGQFSPTFNGGYAELGYVLTREATPYKNGAYDRLTPKRPVGKGGIGAFQLNARYDWLNLNDGAFVGGRQDMAGVSLVWAPIAQLRFIADYGHFWVHDSPVTAAGGRGDYQADAFGLRGQIDF
ncbi:MAG: porin [Novosphingobium sp.]